MEEPPNKSSVLWAVTDSFLMRREIWVRIPVVSLPSDDVMVTCLLVKQEFSVQIRVLGCGPSSVMGARVGRPNEGSVRFRLSPIKER